MGEKRRWIVMGREKAVSKMVHSSRDMPDASRFGRRSGRDRGGRCVVEAAVTGAAALMSVSSIAYAADPSIATMVNNSVNLIFGLVAFGGIVNIVRGTATVARGLQDDGGGQDAAAISKGRGQLLAGAIMVAPTALITLITQQSPGSLISTYFS